MLFSNIVNLFQAPVKQKRERWIGIFSLIFEWEKSMLQFAFKHRMELTSKNHYTEFDVWDIIENVAGTRYACCGLRMYGRAVDEA